MNVTLDAEKGWQELPPTLSDVLRQAVRDSYGRGRSKGSLARETYGDSQKGGWYISRFLEGHRTMNLDTAEKLIAALDLEVVLKPREAPATDPADVARVVLSSTPAAE